MDALVRKRVVFRLAAEILRGDLLKLLTRIDSAGEVRPGHRVRRLAAERHRRPGDVLRRAAPVDDHLVPRHRQRFGGDAREIDAGMRAEIADARLDVQLAVRTNRQQPVVANRAGAVRADGDADTTHLRSLTLSGARLPLLPLEQLGAAIDRLLDERAGGVAPAAAGTRRTVERLAFGRIDPAYRQLIEAELLRRLRDDRLDDCVGLHRTRRALLRSRRRVPDHREAAEAHRPRPPD